MIGPFINKGKHVYLDPAVPGDGGIVMDAAIAIPTDGGLQINGAPVVEQSHEYVLKKKPEANAED